ncbi:MAG TPA: sulfurtransferase TusA family protein [Micropepsaceae bacterium]
MSETLDLTGLKCPMPALLARRYLMRAPAGAKVEVLTDDPMGVIDVPHMCRSEGFELLDIQREGSVARLTLRKP